MKYVILCGRKGGCCPKIKEDIKKGIMHIIGDDGQDIPFDAEQVQNLTKYLNKR